MKKIFCSVFLVICIAVCLAGCGSNKQEAKYTGTDFAMGTTISEVIYGETNDICENAAEEIIGKLKSIETKELSWRVPGSQVYKINHTSRIVSVSESVSSYIKETLQIAKDSDGALDPGIGYLAQLWDIGGEHPKVPSNSEIQQVLKRTGYKNIKLSQEDVKTSKESVAVDLGAVGKGIGADAAMEYLKAKKDVSGAVISVGGSLCVYGSKPEADAWTVGIQDPRKKDGEMLGALSVKGNCFVSTSGDYEKYIERNGKRYHHILDRKTGYPAESGLISVTIICDSGLNSDGLSTACFVLGKDKSQELLKKYNAKAIFVDKQKNVYVSDGVDFELKSNNGYTMK